MKTTGMKAAALLTATLAAALAAPASSQDPYRPLTGTYAISGKTAIDPPPDEPKDTHLQVFLTGAAARDLYQALKVKAVPDECVGPNASSKFSGAIACTMQAGGKEYECSFAVDLKAQKLEAIYAC
jgi:hypothetical protein